MNQTNGYYLNLHRHLLIAACILTSFSVWAQPPGVVTGKFFEKDGATPLIGVNVTLQFQADTNVVRGEVTDIDGAFTIRALRPGAYKLRATYIGYQPLEQSVTVGRTPVDLGVLQLQLSAQELETVVVAGVQTRSEQIGDTTEYNARAYKVNTDASSEELVAKMPGVTVQGGTVQAQGESVRRVTIDGQEFFGDDAVAALRNLPAEVVDKIQVFDRQSDQSRFTGFNDGNTEKTINIVTRPGMNAGQFGRVYAGYGTDDRYLAGANLNYFKGKRRISLISMFNNVNQQNFSSQDILGVLGSSGSSGGGRMGGPGGGGGGGGGRWRSQGPSASDFTIGQQNGISSTNALGLNYTDVLGKWKINASYFYNQSENNNLSELSRRYFVTETLAQLYGEVNETSNDNSNHRLSMRLEYTIDSMNSIIISPRVSLQNNLANSFLNGSNFGADDSNEFLLLNRTTNRLNADNTGLSLNNNILYQHRFQKRGRTISVNLTTDLNDREGVSGLNSGTLYYLPIRPQVNIDQQADNETAGLTLSSFISYTEPIGKNSQLQINYSPSWTDNKTDRYTNRLDETNGTYSLLDTLLSNQLDNEVATQRAGLRYRYNLGSKVNLAVGADVQNTRLTGEQVFPSLLDIDRTFNNLLPFAFFTYAPERSTSLRIFLRSFTNVPSVSQLQNVVDNSNPLLLSTGNADLRQQLSHFLSLRYNKSLPAKGHTIFVLASATRNTDFIGNEALIATNGDTLLQDGLLLRRGAQLNRPVNLDGAWNTQLFLTYGLPLTFIKSNLNMNAGVTYRLSPSLINGAVNEANTYNASGGLVLSSNISQQIDFNIGYNATYNIVDNSLQPTLNSDFFFHTATLRLNWMPTKSLRINTDLVQTTYTGLGEGFNTNFVLWNAAIGYKFLKNKGAEVSLSVFDILKQNTSVGRNVTETFIEDSINRVLTQYFMLNFTYNLRSFGTPPAPARGGGGRGEK